MAIRAPDGANKKSRYEKNFLLVPISISSRIGLQKKNKCELTTYILPDEAMSLTSKSSLGITLTL